MRIILPRYANTPEAGSAETHWWELVRNLVKIRHEVHAIIPNIEVSIKGLKVHKVKVKDYSFLSKLRFELSCLTKILIFFRKHKIDIIYTRSLLTPNPSLISKISGAKLIAEMNGIDDEDLFGDRLKKPYAKNRLFRGLIIKLLKFVLKFNLKNANAIIAVTEGIKEGLIQLGIDDKKIYVISNGVNTDLFKPVEDRYNYIISQIRQMLEIEEHEKVVTFVGIFTWWQGIEYLIKAAPLILEKVPETKFLMVGDGEMREEWESMVSEKKLEDNFIFTGRVPYEEVPKYINASDVCVAPFIKERNERTGLSPLKLYEYLACGKPVVGSDVEGVGDFLVRYNAGITVKLEDFSELANAIIKLLKDEKLREERGRYGREYVVKNHSWESVARKVSEVCRRVVTE